MTLEQFFKNNPKVAIGFSGGVDSSYLLYAGKKYGADIRPYFIKSQFQPAFEFEDAKRLADGLEIELTVLKTNALAVEEVVENAKDRCYHCKKNLFTMLKDQAIADGYSVLIDGTNASDDAADRAGTRAIAELKVLSPLRECGLTKSDVRALSKEAGIFTWDKPSYACLATRIPTGDTITEEKLIMVENAEDFLFSLGFSDFRVRLFDRQARIQLPEHQMPLLLDKRAEILHRFTDFKSVVLDLTAR